MSPSPRRLPAARAAFGTSDVARTGADTQIGEGPPVESLLKASEEANDALMRGDVDRYRSLISMAHDFTLMSPFGGKPSQGRTTDAQWEGMRTFFRNGRLSMELVQAYGVQDMVVLVVIEHSKGLEVGGLPPQDWTLRVTLVFRREGTRWLLAHRHADPLGPGITVAQAARLAQEEDA